MISNHIMVDTGEEYLLDVTPKDWKEKSIEIILSKYPGKYLFEFNGDLIFFQETPDVEKGHSHYFGIRKKGYPSSSIVIFNAEDIVKKYTIATIKKGKYQIYSHHVHDFVNGDEGFIDGGFEYLRLGGSSIPKVTRFKISNGTFFKVNEE